MSALERPEKFIHFSEGKLGDKWYLRIHNMLVAEPGTQPTSRRPLSIITLPLNLGNKLWSIHLLRNESTTF